MDYLKARYGPKGEVYIFKRHIAVSGYNNAVQDYEYSNS